MSWAVGAALVLQLSDVFEGKPELEKILLLSPAGDPRYKELLKIQSRLPITKKRMENPRNSYSKAPSAETPKTGQLSKITLQYVTYSFTIHSCIINQYIKVVSSF